MGKMHIQDRIKEFKRVPAKDLEPHPNNWRTHSKSQVDALRGILAEVGYVDALLVRENGNGRLQLIDGHLRAEITPDMEVPVLVLDVTEAEADKILATFDPLGAMAEADSSRLESLLTEIETDSDALQVMLDELAVESGIEVEEPELVDPEAQIDRAAELQEQWGTERGQLWEITGPSGMVHRLLCGDSTDAGDVERVMGGERANLVVTSPPYNQKLDTFKPSGMQKENPAFVDRMASAYSDNMNEDDYRQQQVAMLLLIAKHMTENGSIFYNHKIRYRDKRAVSPMEWLRDLPFPVRQEIIWDRSSSITLNARMFMPADERIYWLRVGDDFTFNDDTEIKSWSTVWRGAAKNDVKITAAFATEIPLRCIRAASNAGDIVIDPYCGSGTTLVACENLGRRGFGIEIEPKYVAVALERMTQLGCECEEG